MKTYFNKLGKALIYFLFVSVLYIMLLSVLATILNGLVKNETIKSLLFLLIPVIAASIFTYKKRINHTDARRVFLKELGGAEFVWKVQIVQVLRSSDYKAEVAAFFTLMIPTFVLFAIKNILSAAVIVLVCIVGFVFIDLLLWFIVHFKWSSERLGK